MVISYPFHTQYKTLQVNPKVRWKSKNVCWVNSIKRLVEKLLFLKEEFLRELALHALYGERWMRKSPQIFQRRRLWLCYGLLEAEDIPFCPPLCHKHFVPPSNMIPLILDDFDGENLASYSTKNDSRKLRQFKPHHNLYIHPKTQEMVLFGVLINSIAVNNWCAKRKQIWPLQ